MFMERLFSEEEVLGHHKTLGLKFPASQAELKKTYRQLSRAYHPDLHPPENRGRVEEKMKEINAAHSALGEFYKPANAWQVNSLKARLAANAPKQNASPDGLKQEAKRGFAGYEEKPDQFAKDVYDAFFPKKQR